MRLTERYRRILDQYWLIIFCSTLMCSCAASDSNGSVRKHYFGYTIVTYPRMSGNCLGMDAKEVSNAGLTLSFSRGIGIGYNTERAISLSPDGRVIIEVTTDKQFEEAKEFIKELNNLKICVIQETRSTN